MKELFLILAICFTTVISYAQTQITSVGQNNGQYIGVITLKDDTILEGNLLIDFEKHVVKIVENGENRLLSFSSINNLLIYDIATHTRKEFIGLKHNDLYEIVLAGELSLLRHYSENPHNTDANQTVLSYFLYDTQQKNMFEVENIKEKMQNIFQENTALIKNIIQVKQYDLTNLQHIASLIRYQNQCKAKTIAMR